MRVAYCEAGFERRDVEHSETADAAGVQVLRSDLRSDQAPVLAAVGPMQFEVASARMEAEFQSPINLQRLGYSTARRTTRDHAAVLNGLVAPKCALN